ncbi:hypothetical protein ACHAXT_013063 [Thalassiosira profunda]
MDYVQLLFALSPFPSYLPQYFSILQQLAPAGDNDDGSAPDPDEAAALGMDREGGYYLRKRNNQHHENEDSPGAMMATIASPPSSNSLQGISPGAGARKTFDFGAHQNGAGDGRNNAEGVDTGMSRATVLLLLSAHLLRLLYFHGLLLEAQRQRPVPARAGAGMELDELPVISTEAGMEIDGFLTPTAASIQSSEPEKSVLQWDLLGQSLSMIIVQLMLLHAMMLLHRQHQSWQRKRKSDGGINVAEPPLTHSLSSKSNGSQPSWRTKFSRAIILQKHSFLEYMELLFLTSMAVKLFFDVYWYPRYRMIGILWLKHTSIVLESCLALPQAVRNWRRETTEGLSVVMVGGWVAGDFFKLCYFLLNMIGSGGDRGNNVFALGCLLALSLDSVVGFQMAWVYPTGSTLELKQRITRSVRHWSANKDDDAGESLLAQKKDGLFASFLAAFFEWARGLRSNA